jgi:molecular chaperone Hsp33
VTGEIAEDLTYYYATSEQTPSTVALGVLMNKENTVRQSGGFIIQLMPGASDEMISKLEEKLSTISSITSLLDEGKTPEMILEYLLGDFGLEINDRIPTAFSCNCSRSRIEKALISVGRDELQSMIDEGKTIELNCQFCNKHYPVTVEELKELLQKAEQ